MKKTSGSHVKEFAPSPELLNKARSILKLYPMHIEVARDQYFGSYVGLPEVLANATSRAECLRRLEFLGETYIASALIDEVSLPSPPQH